MKKIFNIVIASLAVAALATSCLKEGEPLAKSVKADVTELKPFEASGSPAQTINVTADGDWVAGAPSWIKLSAYSGNGDAKITATPKDNLDAEGEMQAPRSGVITVGGSSATCVIKVRQRGDKGKSLVIYPTISIKEFKKLKEDASVFYHLKGTICDTTYSNYKKYGNFYMTDGQDTILVYGLKASKSAESTSYASLGLHLGSQVSLAGFRSSHKGNPQVGGGYVYDPEKQNIQVSPESCKIKKEGGEFVLDIIARGTYEIASDVTWLTWGEADADDMVTVSVQANTNPVPRSGRINVTVTVGEGESAVTQTVSCIVEQEFPEPDATTIAQDKEKTLGDVVRTHGTVMMASTSTGYIISDGVDNVLIYNKTSFAVGDSVKVIGETSVFNFGFQIKSQNYFEEKLGKGKTVAGTPVQVDSVALVEKTTISGNEMLPCELIEIVGTVYKKGDYAAAKNLAEKKAVNYTASLFTPKGMNLLTDDYLEKKVKLTGYYTAYKSSSKQLTLYLTKVEPITETTPE